jgi:hypothetical protein
MRQGWFLSEWLRVGLLGGGLLVSLLFSQNFLYAQLMLIPIRYPGSHQNPTPDYT